MADDLSDRLSQMAEHRGFKLVKSRRRKPGVGDYGRFGLTDAAGKALLGIGNDGLTASAGDIESYLRSGATGTWQASADSVPDRPVAKPKPQPTPRVPEPRGKSAPKDTGEKALPLRERSAPKLAPPAPRLAVRPARLADAGIIAKMLNRLQGIAIDPKSVRRNLAAVQKTEGGFLLAELGEAVGCCGWAVVRTVHRGAIGRITMLFVDQDHRRRGIATRLLAAAEEALAGKGCAVVEAMSDIQVANAHNFFRALKFGQASYRFVRDIAPTVFHKR